ncbi:MAG TPA: GyrI-like domain-containing protein [Beijerinckia sp.]|jgi:effector-binding domain-containing protein|nr:GyrI-like domain-containing protein [Beijerinckia sp.]
MRFDKMKPLSGLALALGVLLAVLASRSPCFAEESVKPAGVAQAQPAPAPATPEQAKPPAAAEPETKAAPEESAVQIDVPSRPVAFVRGSSDWENGFKSIKAAFDKIDEALKKDGLAPAGHPFTVFTSTDDNGFKFEAMVPLKEKPQGKEELSPDVKLGASPSGKAIKFQHRGAYDDIDSTYDLITAYLDEKGLEAQNQFIEEYLTDTKDTDDDSLEVDIYVFVK